MLAAISWHSVMVGELILALSMCRIMLSYFDVLRPIVTIRASMRTIRSRWSIAALFDVKLLFLTHHVLLALLMLLHLNDSLVVFVVLVLIKAKFDCSFSACLIDVLFLWRWCPFFPYSATSRLKVFNCTSTHKMLLELLAKLWLIKLLLVYHWRHDFFFSWIASIWVHVLLEKVAIELSKTFSEEHICDRLALLIDDLLDSLVLAFISAKWLEVWLSTNALVNLISLFVDSF